MAQVQTGNFPIPNDTGANVLADINENVRANATNNSGSTTPPITLAHQFFVDESTTPDTLRVRNASNNGYIDLGKLETDLGHMPKTGGNFSGSISLPSGTVSSPSIQLNDADTGFYLFASNNIGVTTGGGIRLNINSDGLTINAGKELRLKDPQDNNYIALKSPALSSDLTFTLPNSDGNAGDKLESDGNGNLSWQPVQGVPTGSVHVMATTSVPSGYLECNGGYISRTTYASLYAIIGTTWGTNASSNFRLPDLRGQFVRGWANTSSTDSGRSFASSQSSQNLSHNHSYSGGSVSVSGANHNHNIRKIALQPSIAYVGITLGSGQGYQIGYATNNSGSTGQAVQNSGNLTMSGSVSLSINNNGGSESRPQNIAMMYVIKT
nr:phage tail fiber protein [uncultured Mediterranean phage uvMED]BAR26438.1 phage tail fiber protein [uncultured Mediterranean phage uvMED]